MMTRQRLRNPTALTPEESEELRQLLQPLVVQFQMAQMLVKGYLAGAHVDGVVPTIDLGTGIVTLKPLPAAAPTEPPEPPNGNGAP